MKIIKNINNNYAIAVDNAGNKIIVSGRGIGFGEVPREIKDLSIINCTYYDVDDNYVSMIKDLPEDIITVATKIVEYARSVLENPIGSNLVFTLADHIQFSIQRHEKNLDIKLPILNDIQQLFEQEYEIGQYAVRMLRSEMKIYLPTDEAAYIALHIINAEEREKSEKTIDDDGLIEDIIQIIEKDFAIEVNVRSVNYSRFVSHMHYLLKRTKESKQIKSVNEKMYQTVRNDYKKTAECADHVSEYFENERSIKLTDEEKLYLVLHINRLCSHEDCNQ